MRNRVGSRLQHGDTVTTESRWRTRRAALLSAIGLLSISVSPVHAIGGLIDVEIVSPQHATYELVDLPNSLRLGGDLQSDTTLYVMEEQLQFELPDDVWVDYEPTTREGGTLPAGTMVDAYLIHFDPVVSHQQIRARLAFDEPVLGFISETESLQITDTVIGQVDTEYGQHFARGIDGNDGTKINVFEDGRTVGLNLRVTRFFDEARILVAPASAVPEPASQSCLLLGCFGLLATRSRHRTIPPTPGSVSA